jgi:hypothetical protein
VVMYAYISWLKSFEDYMQPPKRRNRYFRFASIQHVPIEYYRVGKGDNRGV